MPPSRPASGDTIYVVNIGYGIDILKLGIYHDIRRVRIRIGHHYCMSILACQYNQPKWPGDLDL